MHFAGAAPIEVLASERGNGLLRWFDRWLGIPLTLPAAIYRKSCKPRPSWEHPANIGIICLGAIGDALLLSGLTDGIRRLFPQVRLELIGSGANSEALYLNPHADAHFSAPVTAIGSLLSHILSQHFDILIDSSQWARLGNLLCNLSGASFTVGFATSGQARSLGYDVIAQHRSDCHEAENFLALGQALWPALRGRPSVALGKEVPSSRKQLVCCHMWAAPGNGRIFKEWPEENWRELIARLLEKGWQICLTGSLTDAPQCERFMDRYFAANANVFSVAGKISLRELASLLASAGAAVSVNTGIMHLAALAGVPTVGLHGATNPARWGPVGENAISLLPRSGASAWLDLGFESPGKRKPAMANLPVDDVLAALRRLGVEV